MKSLKRADTQSERYRFAMGIVLTRTLTIW